MVLPMSQTKQDPRVVQVHCKPVGRKTINWTYWAEMSDGSCVPLRKRSTQRYKRAHQFECSVATGAKGLAACFKYSVKASPVAPRNAIATFYVRGPSLVRIQIKAEGGPSREEYVAASLDSPVQVEKIVKEAVAKRFPGCEALRWELV